MEKLNQTRFNTLNNTLFRAACLLFLLNCQLLWARGWTFERGGSFKSIFEYERLRQTGIYQYDAVPLNEDRLRFQGALSNQYFRFELANETSLDYQRFNPTTLPIPNLAPTSAWNAQWTWAQTKELTLVNRIDRALIQFSVSGFQLIAGKQVVAIGVGQIFNAVSQMQRYPLIVIDPEYPKTEDAVTVIWAGPLQLEVRVLPKNPGQQKDNFHLRAKGSKGGYDIALTAGRSDDKCFVGFETAGNLGDAVLRTEIVGYNANGKDYAQSLAGIDYVISPTLSTKLEVFYNGFGEASTSTLGAFIHRSAPFRGTWYAGNFTTWEIHPLLKANLLSIWNVKDPSALFHFYLNYSLGNSLDLLAGQFYSVGSHSAEFGGQLSVIPPLSVGQPDITYAALRWYF
jgi:hypothetical protein